MNCGSIVWNHGPNNNQNGVVSWCWLWSRAIGWAQKPFCDDALTAFVSAAPESTDIGNVVPGRALPCHLQIRRRKEKSPGAGGQLDQGSRPAVALRFHAAVARGSGSQGPTLLPFYGTVEGLGKAPGSQSDPGFLSDHPISDCANATAPYASGDTRHNASPA